MHNGIKFIANALKAKAACCCGGAGGGLLGKGRPMAFFVDAVRDSEVRFKLVCKRIRGRPLSSFMYV